MKKRKRLVIMEMTFLILFALTVILGMLAG